MAAGTADLHKAMSAIWDGAGLNDKFTAFWTDDQVQEFIVLHDEEAEGKNCFPYCVYDDEPGTTTQRMSGNQTTLIEYREILWTFTVQAKDTQSNQSAKEIAAGLAEEIMKVFGGHPTIKNQIDGYQMDNGFINLCQYQADFPVRTPTRENYSWVIRYLIKYETPVLVGQIADGH